jgi:flagellar basal body-associated protein FliL
MSDKKPDKAPAAPADAAAAAPAKKSSVKMIGIVGAIMLIEAVAVFFFFSMIGPKKIHAATEHEVVPDAGQETQELVVVEEKFQNMQQGKVWFWDVGIFVQVKAKNAEAVQAKFDQRTAEIKEGISQIFGKAQPAQLKEPDRQTINRQVTAFLAKIVGNDAEGHSLIERVLIPKCRGVPGEF